jgi:uncharacterized membrane protein YjgN (DUF898 family)
MEPQVAPHGEGQPAAFAAIRGTQEEQRHPLEFTASAGEYFRIWIVNLALTVLTLGIYSAWAKVRKRRYFYANTKLAGEGFEYRAKPLAILKGRLIAVVLLAVFYGAGAVSPLLQVALWIPLLIVVPWLLVRSLAFNAFNTAYRNIRFRFSGTYRGLMKLALVYVWLLLLPILYPYVKRRLLRFVAEHHAFGTTPFVLGEGFNKPFIHAYAAAYGMGLLLTLGMVGAFALGRSDGGGYVVAGFLLLYAGFFLVFSYLRARTLNALWGNLSIGPVRLESTLRARTLAWLYVTNLLAVAFTLGLATPWATVRLMRYRAACTTAFSAVPLDGFVQAEGQQVSVAGEETADLFDVDLAL